MKLGSLPFFISSIQARPSREMKKKRNTISLIPTSEITIVTRRPKNGSDNVKQKEIGRWIRAPREIEARLFFLSARVVCHLMRICGAKLAILLTDLIESGMLVSSTAVEMLIVCLVFRRYQLNVKHSRLYFIYCAFVPKVWENTSRRYKTRVLYHVYPWEEVQTAYLMPFDRIKRERIMDILCRQLLTSDIREKTCSFSCIILAEDFERTGVSVDN